MKSIISDSIEALAFDLDGTLYDEFEFIKQVYHPISKAISEHTQLDSNDVYNELCKAWLENGSSANIFQIVLHNRFKKEADSKLLSECVNIYRNAEFSLSLNEHVISFLQETNNYPKVIISDGDSVLQRRKIHALKLEKWFKDNYIIVSKDFEGNHYKPDTYMARVAIELLNTDKIMYFGDRDVDEEFAQEANFVFVRVKNMVVV